MQQQLTTNTLLHGGTYRIINVLGQGSFGITYLAEHVNLGRKVAIKEFFMKELNSRGNDGSITGMSDGSLSYNYGQKFKKEALNLANLDHPNIVRVTDSFDENGTYYYVMDYIDGQNLNDYVKKQVISQSEAISIIKDVADALIYMHEQKHMLHLDLKPGNVMRRNSDGHVFLIDFGLSKHYSNDGQPETSTTIGLGTAGYAPIEQGNKAKNGEFRPTIDVYALGATLYKLLTRETPPAASDFVSDDELLVENLKEKSISPTLIDFIVKAMLPNVRKRIQTVRSFKEMLPDSGYTSGFTSGASVENDEETVFVDYEDEKTELAGNVSTLPNHPDFDEASYVIESKYLNYPTTTNTKAGEGDLDAAIAIGMMALRGKGVKQDSDVAYSWFAFAKDKGDDRGAKVVEQWYLLKGKYKNENTSSTSIPRDSSKKESNFDTVIGVFVIVILVIIIVSARGCGNKTTEAPYYDTVDTAAVDTVAADTAAYYEPAEDFSSGYHEKTYSDGVYKGNWKNNERCGYGEFFGNDGYTYKGNYKNDKPNGKGVETYPKDKKGSLYKYEGNFVAGYYSGYGIGYYSDGDSYEGSWRKSKWHGVGIWYKPDHTYIKANWRNHNLESTIEEGTWN